MVLIFKHNLSNETLFEKPADSMTRVPMAGELIRYNHLSFIAQNVKWDYDADAVVIFIKPI